MSKQRDTKKITLMLDSGAFSAWTKEISIDLNEYISFCKKHLSYLDYIVNLDVIPGRPGWKNIPMKIRDEAALQGLKNYQRMLDAGIPKEKLIHVFHQGEDIKWLKKIVSRMGYIGLSPANDRSTTEKLHWLDSIMPYVTDDQGFPTVKFHGFAVTSLRLMLRYPWYSVDSTSWVMTSRMGSIYVPRYKAGKWIYDENSWKVVVSSKSPAKTQKDKHIETMSPGERQVILDYLDNKGYRLGKSDFDDEGKEIIIEEGLCNNYKLRDEINIIYFLDLEKSMPEWPWPFKIDSGNRGFEI